MCIVIYVYCDFVMELCLFNAMGQDDNVYCSRLMCVCGLMRWIKTVTGG